MGGYATDMQGRSFAERYMGEVAALAGEIPTGGLEKMATILAEIRAEEGRLFMLGVGGGAGHASHAVNDFRKLCGFEAYAPTDNVSELTARTNDEGWDTSYAAWLKGSRLAPRDGLLVFSVGGGSREHGISLNLVHAVELAHEVGARVLALVGRSEGVAAQLADAAIVISAPAERLTPHVEGFQAVLWHLLVSHPSLATSPGKWESVADGRGA